MGDPCTPEPVLKPPSRPAAQPLAPFIRSRSTAHALYTRTLVRSRSRPQVVDSQAFLRKILTDAGGMKLALAGLEAHRYDERVLVQMGHAVRTLLPATPPRPFVEAGGLELLVESIAAHPNCAPLAEVAGSCLHMLSAINNIVRRMILRMEVVASLLKLCDVHQERVMLHEVTLGLIVQLSKGDEACLQLFNMQVSARLRCFAHRLPGRPVRIRRPTALAYPLDGTGPGAHTLRAGPGAHTLRAPCRSTCQCCSP